MIRARAIARSLGAALLAGAPFAVPAQVPPVGMDAKIQQVVFDPNAVIALRIAPGYVGTVIFPDDEVVENVAIGDGGSWQAKASPRGDQLYVEATGGAQTSNMHVVTSLRQYNFLLTRALESDPGAMIQLTIVAPKDQPAAVAPAADAPPAEVAPLAADHYRLSGARRPKPLSIVDDGRRTTIAWPADVPFPAIFAIDGSHELLLNARVVDGHAVIDRVWPSYVFRLDGAEARAVRVPRRKRGGGGS